MNCETFNKSIENFKSRPTLYKALIKRHKEQNKCNCPKI